MRPGAKQHLWYTPDGLLRGRGADWSAWALLPGLAAGFFLLSMVAVVATELMEIVPLSPSGVGLLTSAFLVGGGLAVLPTRVIFLKLGGRTVALGTLLTVAGSVVFALSSSLAGFLVGRVLQGLGAGCLLYVGVVFASTRVVPRLRRRVTLIWASGAGGGVMLAMLILPSLQSASGYRVVNLVAAGLALVLGVFALLHPALRAVPEGGTTVADRRQVRGPMAPVAVQQAQGVAGFATMVVSLGAVSFLASLLVWSALFLQDRYTLTLATACHLSALLGVALLLGVWAGGLVARRGRSFGVWAPLGAATILTSAVPGPEATAGGLALLLGASFFAAVGMTAAHLKAIQSSSPVGRPGQGSPVLPLALAPVVAGVGPWLFGLLTATWGTGPREAGYPAAFLFLTGLALVATVASMADGILARHRATGSGSG